MDGSIQEIIVLWDEAKHVVFGHSTLKDQE